MRLKGLRAENKKENPLKEKKGNAYIEKREKFVNRGRMIYELVPSL